MAMFMVTFFVLYLANEGRCHYIIAQNYKGGMCTPKKRDTLRIVIQHCDGKTWRTMVPAGEPAKKIFGKSCLDIKNKGLNNGDGVYKIDPDGGSEENAFIVYCDMTSFGGGWTMCYTTDNHVNTKAEISSKFPYGTDGYRTNCNNILFTETMFVDEKSKQKAAFVKTGSPITLAGNYDKSASTYGLWNAHGVASKSYRYQLLICDTTFYKGLHVSGYTKKCFKKCDSWCGDVTSPYFRTAAVTSASYAGVAFNENGHRHRPKRLMSAGVR